MFCKSVAEIQLNQPYVFKKLDLSSAASEFVFSISHVALSKLMELLTQVSLTLSSFNFARAFRFYVRSIR